MNISSNARVTDSPGSYNDTWPRDEIAGLLARVKRPGRSITLGAALFQWVNPKSWLVSASAAGTFLHAGASPLGQAAALGGLFVLAALPSGFVWLAFGASMRRVLSSPRRLRTFNVAMGVLLALTILLIVR